MCKGTALIKSLLWIGHYAKCFKNIILFDPHNNPGRSCYYYHPYFAVEETEAEAGLPNVTQIINA